MKVFGWQVQGPGWWAPPLALWWCCTVPRSGFVGLVVDGQHRFMVQGSGYSMMKPTLARRFLWTAIPGGKGVLWLSGCPAKGGVDSVHTYVCFMEMPMAVNP